jgi:conjugal transfer/type IV secretion protein DotA/TraY
MRLFKNILFLLLLGLVPGLAFAQDVFAPSSGDISMIVLSQIFGGLMSSGAAASGTLGGSDPMLNAISTFNGAVLTIGGILAAYTILAGTLGTAHDGEMLGKKFSSVWIPIRYSLGTALVLPIVGGGYCIMQLIVMWLVVQGIGLADAAWSSYMSAPNQSANINMPTMLQDQVLILAENVFTSEVCLASYNQVLSDTPSILKGNYNFSMTSDTDPVTQKEVWHFGDQSGITSFATKNSCGQVTGNPATIVANNTSNGTTSNTGKLGALDNLFTSPDISGITTAQNNATNTLITSMSTLATQLVQKQAAGNSDVHTNAKTYYAQIQSAATTYVQSVTNSAQSLVNGNSNAYTSMQQAANTQGWFMAGAWFMKIIDINQKITDAMNMVPSSDSSTGASSLNLFSDAGKYMVVSQEVLSVHYGNDAIPTSNDTGNTDTSKQQDKEAHATGSSVAGKIGALVASTMTKIDLYNLKDDTRHPIIIINDMGNRLVTACTTIMLGIMALNIGSIFVGGALNGLIQTVVQFLQIPIGALWGVGFSASTMIPMIPFLIWLGSLIGWLILVVEAVLAAPLWAVMHLHPNGEDLTGRGGNGYMLVLSLLLRPVLMIFGLITAIVLSAVMGEFINKVFFQVFAVSQGSDLTGFSAFFEILFGTVIYCIIMFTFISKMFSIIHIVPDQLMRWMGGGQDNLGGQMASAFESSGKQGFGVATGAAAQLGSSMSQTAGNIGNKIREGGLEGRGGATGINRLGNAKDASDAGLDKAYGAGTSGTRDSVLGHSTPKSYSAAKKQHEERTAYNKVLDSIGQEGGQSGVQSFESQMREAASDGFKDFDGDKNKAVESIAASVISDSLAGREIPAPSVSESSSSNKTSDANTK